MWTRSHSASVKIPSGNEDRRESLQYQCPARGSSRDSASLREAHSDDGQTRYVEMLPTTHKAVCPNEDLPPIFFNRILSADECLIVILAGRRCGRRSQHCAK